MSETCKRILWIDDEVEFLRSHVVFLETRGYAVSTASGGDDGIRLIRGAGDPFDIVLLDKQMPVKSGAATLDEIKTYWPHLPVIMLTGYQHAADAVMEKKYDGYLTKPVDPAALLGTCKQIIEGKEQTSRKFTGRYMRGYTENKALLGGELSASGWMNLYTSLSRWDLEIDAAGEGVRQMQAGLKSDGGAMFCDFVIDNYAQWASGRPGRPLMAVDVLGKVIGPELAKGRGVLMVVLSGMTLGQFLAIEPVIKRIFSVTATRFMSALPTMPNFCVPALSAGMYPGAVDELEPGVFGTGVGACDPVVMKRLMRTALERAGAGKVKTHYARADGANGRRHLKAAVDTMKKAQTYGVLLADIVNKFTDTPAGKQPKEALPGDAELRRMIESWFVNSAALLAMREVCSDTCTVIVTSDHGHTRCGRASEIYETSRVGPSLRNMFGTRISVDEREVFMLEELPHFKLPQLAPGTKCLMARENYYFAAPGKCGGSRKKSVNKLQSGGISLQEMIMPLYVCRPFGSGGRQQDEQLAALI
ncbi:MAG: response regulator [Chitinispirillia bacterium]|nr:response regulator [Chitinispirillia bacterium]MCL2242708.1 response regulator [Chitinispirillia bacterium]